MRQWLVVMCALAGCSGSAALTPETYGNAYATAECKQLLACGVAVSMDDCEQIVEPPDTVSLVAAVTAKTVTFDAKAAAGCTAAVAATSCDQNNQDNRVAPAACAQVFVGSAAVGGACEIDAECASGACTVPSCGSACCEGACVATLSDLAIGAACTNDVQCAVGSYCARATDGSSAACAPLLAANALCTGGDQCAYGLGCLGGDGPDLPPGLCGPGPHAGAACNDGLCGDLGTLCTAMNVCVQVALAGDACGSTAICSPQLQCDGTYHCAPFPELGAGCSGPCDGDSYCDIPSGMTAGTCAAKQANGATCMDSLQCTSGYCAIPEEADSGTCDDEPACT